MSSGQALYSVVLLFFFFFNDTATTEIYTLSLHDALPILIRIQKTVPLVSTDGWFKRFALLGRSEEHTSELQSHSDLVCRLLLEKKKKTQQTKYKNTEDADSNRKQTCRGTMTTISTTTVPL